MGPKDTQKVVPELDALFHARSVAVVGVPRGAKTGKLFLTALLDQGFAGSIYPVHPQARTASMEIEIYEKAARTVAADPQVDAVVVVGIGRTPDANRRYLEAMIQAREESGKPFLIVNVPGFDAAFARDFFRAGVPFFESAERAIRTYARVLGYQRWRARRGA